jgi:hypothetical protein
MAIKVGDTYEWVFDTAQTDLSIFTVGATERLDVSYAQVNCTNSNLADVPVRLGMATATLPTVTKNSATGNAGMVLSHPGISSGVPAIAGNGSAVIARGALGADLRLTCGTPTYGELRIVVQCQLLTDQ